MPSSFSTRPTNPSASILAVISSDLLYLLLDRLPDPRDRKSWRLVCKDFLIAERCQRKFIKVLRDDAVYGILKNYRSLEAVDLSQCPRVDGRLLFMAFGRNSTSMLRSVDLSRSPAVRWWGLEALVGACPRLENVDLSYCCGVGDLEMAALARAGELRELNVVKCLGVTDVGLARVAVGCSELKRLRLKWCLEITDIGIDLLTKKCRGLMGLDLSYLEVTNASLLSISSLESLEVLCLVGCFYIDDNGLDYLNNGANTLKTVDVSRCDNISSLGLTSLIRGHRSIEKLTAGYCGLVIGPSLLSSLKESEKCLKSIELDGFYVSISVLQTIGIYCKSLVEIGLSKCGVTDEGILRLVFHCSDLRKIDLTCCHLITDSTLSAIGKHCKKIRCLKLESCALISAKGLNEIGTHCLHLQEIDLTDCCINDKGLEYLSQCLKLVELKLGLCSNITDKGLSFIGSNCRRLQILDLYRCMGIGDESLASIASGCKKLKRLNICYCSKISNQGLKHLSVLEELSDLEMRKLSNITDACIAAIAVGCKSLVEIDLKLCHGIGDMALWALARYTENLRQINISSCLVTDVGLFALVTKLRCLQDMKLVNLPFVSKEGLENALRLARDRLTKLKMESGLKSSLSPMIIHALENNGCRIRWVDKPAWNVDILR